MPSMFHVSPWPTKSLRFVLANAVLLMFFVGATAVWADDDVDEEVGEAVVVIVEAVENGEMTQEAAAEAIKTALSKTKDAKKEEAKEEPKKEEAKKDDEKKDDVKKEEPKKGEPKKDEPKKEDGKPDTLELKKEPMRLTVKLNGMFESKKAETVRLKGEEFSNFELREVIQHGTKVRKGDVLIKFNPKKYEEALAERKRALRLSEISIQEEEINLRFLEKRRPLQKEAMERNKKENEEDLIYFINVRQEMMKKMAGFWVRMYGFYLESAKEELRQLEKMYENDDLIEDTEEFVLKRSKFYVETYEFFLDMEKTDADYMINKYMPRMETRLRHSAKMEELDYQKSKETFDFAQEQAKLRYEKAKEAHEKLVEQFEKFAKDKQMLVLRAPCDGIVYYGEYNGKLAEGKWNNASTVASGMKIDEAVTNKQVLFTIIDPKPGRIRATVAEKDLHWVDTGTKGTVAPTAWPDARYDVRVTGRNDYPTANNDYVALLAVDLPDQCKIRPNMTGSVELVVYDKKETILVPTASLKREEVEDDSWSHAYLYVYKDDKKVDKIKVKTGQVKGDKTELLSGIAAGAKVFKKFEDGEKWIEQEKEKAEKAKKEKEEAEKAEKEKKAKEETEKAEKAKKDKEAAGKSAKEKAEKEKKAKEAAAAKEEAEKEKKSDEKPVKEKKEKKGKDKKEEEAKE